MDRGIGSWVAKQAFRRGDKVALVDDTAASDSFTYTQFDDRTSQLGRALIALGVRRGDRVAMLLFNSISFMEAIFACAKLGAIAVPVNVRLTSHEIAYILADCGADVLVYHQALGATARAALEQQGVRVRHRVVDTQGHQAPAGGSGAGADRDGLDAGELDYDELRDSATCEPLGMDVDDRDIHAIMYTSGTTGRPKGAMLTHANAIANARNALLLGRGLRSDDVTVTVAPMFHIGGLGVHSLPLVYVGGKNVIQSGFDPVRLLQAMSGYRATVQFLVPAMWAALTRVADFDAYDLSSLELAVSGGAPAPLPVIRFFRSHGVPFQEGFGMTETAPSVSVLDSDHVESKAGSIGRPLPDVEARIVDEHGRDVPTSSVGELVLRGDNIFAGYWMMPGATAEAFEGGWFHTGDLARCDEEGFITLVDRLKDMIITGGENVYPIEVEQVIYLHPAVLEVAVYGIPDDTWGETVVAAVVVKEGSTLDSEELINHCRERLAHFKCPTVVEMVQELPRNATGKVLKSLLRERHAGTTTSVHR
ncbi:MAG: long-chain fatty acid--CoA ligase [Actinobacteria bacterium]|nr:long-chain fatty acid--CoA ligase [Actinomycetota bacterium]